MIILYKFFSKKMSRTFKPKSLIYTKFKPELSYAKYFIWRYNGVHVVKINL